MLASCVSKARSPNFDPRHALDELAKASQFYNVVPRDEVEHFADVFAELNQRWRANHPYYSHRQFLDYMNDIQAEFRQKGNRWKNLCRTILNLAHEVYNLGEAKWGSWQRE